MSQLKVNAISDAAGANGNAITLATDGTCTAKVTNKSGHNLVTNGSFQIAQRGTSSTTSGYGSIDRFKVKYSGTDEAPTHAQVDVASGTTPYTLGFRKALKVTNGNQTSGAGADDYIEICHLVEGQNIANSGWNYLSDSSYITLSFWVKSSVAQNFYGYIRTHDGTKKNYPFETGSLSADTWTKITKTIAGNSGLTIDNDNGAGIELVLPPFLGTNDTASVTLNQWTDWNSGVNKTSDFTSTWYTTNDATYEITGVQLEVSDHATEFEFKSYGDELARCQRYYENSYNDEAPGTNTSNGGFQMPAFSDNANNTFFHGSFVTSKRHVPTMTYYRDSGTSGQISYYRDGVNTTGVSVSNHRGSRYGFNGYINCGAGWTNSIIIGHWVADSEL